MKRLSIYYTPTFANVEVVNGVTKAVTSTNMVDVIKSLDIDSLSVLVAFCRAVCQTVDEPNNPSMFMVSK